MHNLFQNHKERLWNWATFSVSLMCLGLLLTLVGTYLFSHKKFKIYFFITCLSTTFLCQLTTIIDINK